MDISTISIQAGQGDYLKSSAGIGPRKNEVLVCGLSAGEAKQTTIKTPQAQMISISSSVDFINEQLKTLLNSFPPFFPAGSPQRIDLIKGIQGLQEKIEKASVPGDLKKETSGPKLTDQATDQEISAALDGLNRFREVSLQGQNHPAPQEPGKVLSVIV
jgi:hypothetical protein